MKTIRFLTLLAAVIAVVFIFFFDSCEPNFFEDDPTVSTTDASEITDTSAKVSGVADGASITLRGVVFDTTPNPANYRYTFKGGAGAFTVNLRGLNPLTKYYYKAWAMNQSYGFGELKSFTTTGR